MTRYTGDFDGRIKELYEAGKRPLHIWRILNSEGVAVSKQTVYNKCAAYGPETLEKSIERRIKDKIKAYLEQV